MAVEVTEGSRPSRQPGVGRVKSNIEESGAWERSIAIELDTDEVEERIQEVVKRVRRKVQLPGFRKGKVPVHVVENKFWDQIQNDVIQSIVPDAVNEVLAEHELRVASQPRVEDLEFERGRPSRSRPSSSCGPSSRFRTSRRSKSTKFDSSSKKRTSSGRSIPSAIRPRPWRTRSVRLKRGTSSRSISIRPTRTGTGFRRASVRTPSSRPGPRISFPSSERPRLASPWARRS